MIEAEALSIVNEDARKFELVVPRRARDVRFQRGLKRAFDFAAAAVLLLLLLPVFVALAVAIKLDSRGPVFYRQPRLGQGPEIFDILKFRTMVVGADVQHYSYLHLNEASGPLFKVRDDPRITRVGRFIRRHYLDELPQLFNVLRGEMSMVGPRPCLNREMLSTPSEQWAFRFSVPQGITGPWQTNGHHSLTFEETIRVEHEYISNWSFLLDIKILLQTIPLVLKRTGY